MGMGIGNNWNITYMWSSTIIILGFSLLLSICVKSIFGVNKLYSLYSKKHLYENSDKTEKESKSVLLNKTKVSFKLIKVVDISRTAKLFIFSYSNKYDSFGLSICKHVKFYGANSKGVVEGEWNGIKDAEVSAKEITRSYTPIYIDTRKREVHFIIRIYYADGNYVDGGKMSKYLSNLQINEEIKIFGPLGLLEYNGNGSFSHLSNKFENIKHIVMLAGGTGMTPFFRLINNLLFTNNNTPYTDTIYMTLIYANRDEEEILLKPVFDELSIKFVNFKIVYSIDKCLNAKKVCNFENIGFINLPLLKKYVLKYEKLNLNIPSANTLILICGPPRMTEYVQKLLKDITTEEHIVVL